LRANLEADLVKDPTLFVEYTKDLMEFERERLEGLVKKGRPQRDTSQTVTASNKSILSLEMLLGYFWPVDVYLRVKGKKPVGNITSMEFEGKDIRGVLLDESHGRPVGTIAVHAKNEKGVKKACGCCTHLY
jgi:hypothetical protein